MDYLKLLEHSFEMEKEVSGSGSGPKSRLEYLGEYIFNFTTYDSEMSELFAAKAVEICAAINCDKTFEYIKDQNNYIWFLLMCNMPFFVDKLEWGVSIRGAWWDYDIEFSSYGLWNGDEQLTEIMKFNSDEWKLFIDAFINFANG
jgi:hypothetical protein